MISDAKLIPPGSEDIYSIQTPQQMEDQAKYWAKVKRENTEFDLGFANVIFEGLKKQIDDFQGTIKDEEEIAAYLSSFGKEILIRIQTITFEKPYLIVFDGFHEKTTDRVRLVQHTSQISVLFEVMEAPQGRKPFRIGFHPNKE